MSCNKNIRCELLVKDYFMYNQYLTHNKKYASENLDVEFDQNKLIGIFPTHGTRIGFVIKVIDR